MPSIEKREVPSGITPWPWVDRMAVQRLVLRDRQDGHVPAFRRVKRNDVIALFDRRNAGTDIDDDAGAFVAEDRGKQSLRIGARQREFIGVADAGRFDLDQNFAGARAVELDRRHFKRLSWRKGHRGANIHLSSSWSRLVLLRESGASSIHGATSDIDDDWIVRMRGR